MKLQLLTSRAGPLKKCTSSGPLYDGSGNNKKRTEKKSVKAEPCLVDRQTKEIALGNKVTVNLP